jgi:hypothetical protein
MVLQGAVSLQENFIAFALFVVPLILRYMISLILTADV